MLQSSDKKITRAMILAAGLGTRLRPLTYKTPKPLLRVNGKAIIDYNLELLKKAGVEEVIINIHHLGDQIIRHIGNGRRFGLKVRYSKEKTILGTGGGIKKAENFFQKRPFFVINADVLIKIDLKKVEKTFFLNKKAVALMVVRRRRPGEDFAKIDADRSGRLIGFDDGKFMYTGVQILSGSVFGFLKIPSCLIKNGYKKFLTKGMTVLTFLHRGEWNDIGTPETYNKINKIKAR